MATQAPLYAVYNRDCGHVIGVHNNRATFEPLIAKLEAAGTYSLRTRRATDADIEAVVKQVMCDKCRYKADGHTSP